MKKSIASLVAIATISISVNAQIPNSGFETWTNMGSYDNPDNWGTMNSTTALSSVYTAQKGTPGSPGSSYLKLTSKTVGPGVVNGVAVSGVLDPLTQKPVSGFAFSEQPKSLTGKWQHMIYGSSQGSISVALTKWNTTTSHRDTIATAVQNLTGMAMSWANFTINLNYTSSVIPDSCIILLKASGSTPTNNDYLWVDNLAFSGSVAGINEISSSISEISVFPNPTSDVLQLKLNSILDYDAKIELINLLGDIIYSKNESISKGESTFNIQTKAFSKGAYFLKITSDSSTEERQIILE